DDASASRIAAVGRIDANRGVEARVLLDVAQPVDAVTHHQAHGASVVVRPHRFRAVLAFDVDEFLGDEVERIIPGDRLEAAGTFGPDPAQRVFQPVGVMLTLGVARDLGADDTRRVIVVLGAVHTTDGVRVDEFPIERAGRWTVVRAGGKADPFRLLQRTNGLIHGAATIASGGTLV